MSRALVEKDVDGKKYQFSQFNTTQGLKHLGTLTQIVGEPLAIALGVAFQGRKPKDLKSLLTLEIPGDAVQRVVSALLQNLVGEGTDKALNLIKELTSGDYVLCDSGKVVFDAHYAGPEGLAHLAKVVRAALAVQYGNFWDAVSAKATQAVTAVPPPPPPGIAVR